MHRGRLARAGRRQVRHSGFHAVCPVGDVGLRLAVFSEGKRPAGDEYLEDVARDPEGVFTLVDGNPPRPLYKWPCFRNSSAVWRTGGGATAWPEHQTARIRSRRSSVFPSPPGPAKMSIISGSLTHAATKDMYAGNISSAPSSHGKVVVRKVRIRRTATSGRRYEMSRGTDV